MVKPEGFVLRLARRFSADEFGTAMAKYVRQNHVQTGDDFSKLYPRNKAKLCSEALSQVMTDNHCLSLSLPPSLLHHQASDSDETDPQPR